MVPYILTFVAVAVFPLALAGYGGHLATLAMPEHSRERRKALVIVWGLAILGIVAFGVSQMATYRSDKARDREDTDFRIEVRSKLQQIMNEPNDTKKKEDAGALNADIATAVQRTTRAAIPVGGRDQQGVFSQVSPAGEFPGTVYALPHVPKSASSTLLYYNGVLQRQDKDYSISGTTIILNFRTMSGDSLLVTYYH